MDDFERADLAAQYAKVNAKIEELNEVKNLLRDRLLEDGVGTRDAGNLKVQVTENRRLNAKKFVDRFSVLEHPDYYDLKPKAAVAKAIGDDDLYDSVGYVVKVV